MSTYDPTSWVTSMQRALKDYILAEVDAAVGTNQGLDAFDVVFDYPTSLATAIAADFQKTIIHLEIDDIENIKLGFGTDIVDSVYTPSDVSNPATVVESEARCHKVNFDVGTWASDQSGGSTSRLVAYEILDKAFGGEFARKKCMDATQGVEIVSFMGGRFLVDTINDIRVFRMVNSELVVRVYSRKDGEALIVPDSISQSPQLTIPPLAITG